MNQNFNDEVDETMKNHMDSLLRDQNVSSPSPENGECVPQRLPGSVDSRDKPQNRGAEFFIQEDGSYFPVTSALEKRYDGLVDKDSPALVEIGPVVNVQFEWPGYPSKEYQLQTVDWREPPRKTLARDVAMLVKKFVEDIQGEPIDPNHARWRIGRDGIRVEDLRLAAFEQVSAGNWQVRLYYKRSH